MLEHEPDLDAEGAEKRQERQRRRREIEKAPLSVDERRQKVAVALFIGIFVVLGSIALLGYIFSK